jgi:hypothetical protein
MRTLDRDLFRPQHSSDVNATSGRSAAPEGACAKEWLRRRNLGLLLAVPGAQVAIGALRHDEPGWRVARSLKQHFSDADAQALCMTLGLEPEWFDKPHRPCDVPESVMRIFWQFNATITDDQASRAAREAREVAREERDAVSSTAREARKRQFFIASIRRRSAVLCRMAHRLRLRVRKSLKCLAIFDARCARAARTLRARKLCKLKETKKPKASLG